MTVFIRPARVHFFTQWQIFKAFVNNDRVLMVQAFQVMSKGVLRLSPFQLNLPKDTQSQGDQGPNLIETKCLRILKLYNKVFIGLIDKANGILSLHRVFRCVNLQAFPHFSIFSVLTWEVQETIRSKLWAQTGYCANSIGLIPPCTMVLSSSPF